MMTSVKGYCRGNINLVGLVLEENLYSMYDLLQITGLQRCYSHLERRPGVECLLIT